MFSTSPDSLQCSYQHNLLSHTITYIFIFVTFERKQIVLFVINMGARRHEARGDSCSLSSESRYCHCLLFFYFLIKSVSPFIVLLTFFSGQNLILWYSITALTSDTNSFSRRSIRLSGNCKPAWLNRLFAFPFTYPLFLHLDNFAVVRLLKKFRIFLIICVISCSSDSSWLEFVWRTKFCNNNNKIIIIIIIITEWNVVYIMLIFSETNVILECVKKRYSRACARIIATYEVYQKQHS